MPDASKSCWICLANENDEPPGGKGTVHEWRKICNCNLYAHEECLIHWAATQESEDKCCCPQCQTPIRIRKSNSSLLSLRQLGDKVVSTVFSGALTGAAIGSIGGAVGAGAYAMLYGLGASYVNLMCSPAQAYRIFGPLIQAKLDGTLQAPGLTVPAFLRRALLIPQIPLALVASRSRAEWTGPYLTLLPFLAAGRLQIVEPYQRSLLLIVALRYVHRQLYDFFIDDAAQCAAEMIRGKNPDVPEEENEMEEDMRELDDALEMAIENNLQANVEFNVDREFAAWVDNIGVLQPNAPMPQNLEEMRAFLGLVRNQAQARRQAERQVPPPGSADWVFGASSTIKKICYPLLLPYCGVAAAKLLRLLPFFRNAPVLELNLLGSALVVLLRDVVNAVTLVLRVKQSQTFHVLNYYENDTGKKNWVDRLAQYITPLLQFELIIER